MASVARPAFDPSTLADLQSCTQVAAVCYRLHKKKTEFLLVNTSGGRWTFPKGSIEPGLTHAQAAALEAFEEAGVHGRMETISFATYLRGKTTRYSRRNHNAEIPVAAFLCEVLRVDPPQESKRNPTWFSVATAKRRLKEDRRSEDGTEMSRMIDLAIKRIQTYLPRDARNSALERAIKPDGLHKVQFEALEPYSIHPAAATATLARSTTVKLTANKRAAILPFQRH
jgi:8-oxo-dGTP pyrophosphatase MutT (NUDIX family)